MIFEKTYAILPIIGLFLVCVNIPFGFIRSKKPKFSRAWGRCIYIPILISIFLRRIVHLSFHAIPFFLIATLLGQVVGTFVRSKGLLQR